MKVIGWTEQTDFNLDAVKGVLLSREARDV